MQECVVVVVVSVLVGFGWKEYVREESSWTILYLHASIASRPSTGMGQVAYVMICSEVELLVLYALAGNFPTKVSMRVHTITVLHKVIRIWPPSLSAVGKYMFKQGRLCVWAQAVS